MSETHFSCDTVDRELWLAILSSLLCPETDRNIRIGKQGYVFYFTGFKKWCFDVSFLTSISVSTVVWTLGKVEFFKYIYLRNVLFIGFVKFERKQWFLAYQDQVCARGLVSLDCRLRLLENYFCIIFFKRNGFIFRFLVSRTCSMPRQDFFVPYLLPSHVKYYPLETFRHFKTAGGKNL